jgi:hypothetical protein
MLHNYKVGDKVRVLDNIYGLYGEHEKGEINFPGNIVYITCVKVHGCQLAFHPEYDPDRHSYASRFFSYDEFEHVD